MLGKILEMLFPTRPKLLIDGYRPVGTGRDRPLPPSPVGVVSSIYTKGKSP